MADWLKLSVYALVAAAALARARTAQARTRRVLYALVLGVLAVELRSYGIQIARALAAPPEWDFLCFWLWGRLAVTGADFYDPAASAWFAAGRSADFVHEIIGVGFWYPPWSMLLFAPLGLASPERALAVWYLVQASCLLAASWLAWRLLAPRTGRLGLLATAALILALPATRQTFQYAQTHSLNLLLVLLAYKERDHPRAGLFAALATMVKPYLVVTFGLPLLRRNWRALGVGAVTVGLVLVLTGLCFGWDRFHTFLVRNPAERFPVGVFSEGVNQSFFAVALRLTGMEEQAREPMLRAILEGLALMASAPALWAAWITRRSAPLLCGFALLSAALLAYPFTLSHYGMMVAPVLVLLAVGSSTTTARQALGAALIVAVVFLSGARGAGQAFWALVLVIGWIVFEAVRVSRQSATGEVSET